MRALSLGRIAPWLRHVGAPLLAGGVLYVGWRSRALLFWGWSDALGARMLLEHARDFLHAVLPNPPEWLRYTLPDALWVYALAYAIARTQRQSSARVRALWLLLPAAMGPGAELLQWIGALPGTFDPCDLCASAFAVGLALFVCRERAQTVSAGRAPIA
jgi:hypothetical protein